MASSRTAVPPGAAPLVVTAAGAEPAPRARGRPRSEQAERAIIDAALDVFAETGIGGLCIERVAARAGVGKATIYRRWPGKEELLLDALSTIREPMPEPAGKSVRDDLITMLDSMRVHWTDPRRGPLLALMLGEGPRYPRLMDRYMASVVEPRREIIRSVLRRGIATGELRGDTDVETCLYMLTGALLGRAGFGRRRVESGFCGRIVDELLAGIAAG
jgi:AcrR family transcriptional regulator